MGKRIVIAPLNWGLGHATRCIPLIRLLQARNHTVLIASDGDSLALLKREFPGLSFFELPAYNIRYSKNIPAWLYTLWRTPKFLKTIRREQRALEKLVRENPVDLIIADNRYGCRVKNIHSVFISHQLNLIMPAGTRWMGGLINLFHRRFIGKFNTVWIPDAENHAMSGALSQTQIKAEFIGVQSRFSRSEHVEAQNKFAMVLSGPEPQRTLLEKNLLPQVMLLNLPAVFVRGLLSEKMGESEIDQVKIFNYLPAHELQQVIEQSEIIIARSGYSTLMDLAVLHKKAVLVPTPGQPEQEYLAEKFHREGVALRAGQETIDLEDTLERSEEFTGFKTEVSDHLLIRALEKLGL